jgi:hypothetical protein
MTLMREGEYGAVKCDGCGSILHTEEKNLILAFHVALKAGWIGGDDFRPMRRGIFCVSCARWATPGQGH